MTAVAASTFAHVIVEQRAGQLVRIVQRHASTVSCGGQWPSQAIQRLLDGFGAAQFDTDRIVSFDEATFDDHMEFLVPHLYRLRIPSPSTN